MQATYEKYKNNTGTELYSAPDYGINKCWEKVGTVIQQKIGDYSLDYNESLEIKNRQEDQGLKINLVYRMMKCCLEDLYPDSHLEEMELINNKLDLFLSDILNQDEDSNNIKDIYTSQFGKADEKITELTDKIVRFFIIQLRTHSGSSNIVDIELLEEVFSHSTADIIVKNIEGDITNSTLTNLQENLGGLRSNIRDIEVLDEKCKQKFFQNKIDNGEITDNEARRKLNKLKLAYGLAKWKFHGTYRDTKERYFDHLREVAEIVLNNHENATFDQVIVAILHDIVEDTNISIATITKLFGEKIALSVELITKKSELNFVNTKIASHQKMKLSLEKSTLINNNGLLCDRVKSLLRKIEKGDNKINLKSNKPFTPEEKELLIRSGLTSQETVDLWKLNFLKERYKGERNMHYFSKYQDHEEMMTQANDTVMKRVFVLTPEQVREAANNSIVVKLADRHHNLNTLWNIEKIGSIIRKVTETVDSLLGTPIELCEKLRNLVIEDVVIIIGNLLEIRDNFTNTQEKDFQNLLKKIRNKSQDIVLFKELIKV